MTKEEFTNRINEMVSKPDDLEVLALKLIDDIGVDLEELNTIKASVSDKDAKIKSLQDTNMKLFLSVTGAQEDQGEEPVDEDIKATEDFFNNL